MLTVAIARTVVFELVGPVLARVGLARGGEGPARHADAPAGFFATMKAALSGAGRHW